MDRANSDRHGELEPAGDGRLPDFFEEEEEAEEGGREGEEEAFTLNLSIQDIEEIGEPSGDTTEAVEVTKG